MNVNPYQPSTTVADPDSSGRLWKTIARFTAAIYGCVYVAFCTFAIVGDIQDQWSYAWIATNAIVDALTAYGIFAMALPMIRHGELFPIWRLFVWMLPIYLCVAAAYEISIDLQPLTLIEFVFVILLLVIFLAPAITLNFMLRNRLRTSTPAHHNGT